MSIHILRFADNAYAVHLNTQEIIYISYDTVVAYSGPSSQYRTDANHSKTTNKHLGLFGASQWPRRDQMWLDALRPIAALAS
jgi:hypothetical protein